MPVGHQHKSNENFQKARERERGKKKNFKNKE